MTEDFSYPSGGAGASSALCDAVDLSKTVVSSSHFLKKGKSKARKQVPTTHQLLISLGLQLDYSLKLFQAKMMRRASELSRDGDRRMWLSLAAGRWQLMFRWVMSSSFRERVAALKRAGSGICL